MKKSFKYILLILMISFIIAILCCRDHSFEQYASYPFKEDEKYTFNRLITPRDYFQIQYYG